LLWFSNGLDKLSVRVFSGVLEEYPRSIASGVELARARNSYELGKKSSNALKSKKCSNKLAKRDTATSWWNECSNTLAKRGLNNKLIKNCSNKLSNYTQQSWWKRIAATN